MIVELYKYKHAKTDVFFVFGFWFLVSGFWLKSSCLNKKTTRNEKRETRNGPNKVLRAYLVVFLLCGICTVSHATEVEDMEGGSLAIVEADQLIKEVFTSLDIERYEMATEAYFSILERLPDALEEDEARIVSLHMRALALILEESELEALGIDVKKEGAAFLEGFVPDISERLIRWWRLQDLVPTTSFNDRLAEHLQRVVIAWSEYALPKDPRGFDDRGSIFVRLGEPSIRTKIRLLSIDLQQSSGALRIPLNEFWVYHHVAYDAHYIFTRASRKKGYQISTPMDLIPKQLQISRRNTFELLQWMDEVYGQLAVHHNLYGSLYDEVANYIALPGRGAQPADVFARTITHNARAEDQQLVWQRSKNVPVAYSSRFGEAADLDVPYRTARFLERDGRTRLEVYWSLEADAMKPKRRFVRRMFKQGHEPSENYLVSLYSALRDIDLVQPKGFEKHYLTDVDATDKLPVKSVSLIGDTPLFNLVLHWEQRWTIPGKNEEQPVLPGVLVKYRSEVADSIEALHAEGASLEMSDLKVLHFEEGILPEEADPYPYPGVSDSTQIALYFEVYNLTYGEDDRTAYTISYEVRGKKDKKGGGTRASTSHTSTDRNTQEYIIPDLTNENVGKGIEIVLTIRDDLTGEVRRRTVQFN